MNYNTLYIIYIILALLLFVSSVYKQDDFQHEIFR